MGGTGSALEDAAYVVIGLVDRIGGVQRRADDCIALEIGQEADGLAGQQSFPQFWRKFAGLDEHARDAGDRFDARDCCVGGPDIELENAAMIALNCRQLAQLAVESTRQQ